MGRLPQLLDQFGRPVERGVLTREVAQARTGTVRTPLSGDPAYGLEPGRLAAILRSADGGDPMQAMELAEIVEERNPHYLGVLSTRKRSVSQIKVRVTPASTDPGHIRHAEALEAWIDRQELQGELFDILDAIGKGWSFTEIIWDVSMGQTWPARLEWRDPRWFRPSRDDLRTPMMLDERGHPVPLPPFKFIHAEIKAKSGLPLRSGISRIALWNWLFKSFSEKDWAIFCQTYGQPLRIGKWGPGASEDDKNTLFRAVANVAGDCAAIIPESMEIEFTQSGQLSATGQLYRDRVDYLDQQVSKAVLGQTATTDAVTGGLGSGKEHRQVQEDIERADAMALSAILTRDIARPFTDLNFGAQDRHPRIVIADEEPEDLEMLVNAVSVLVPLGMRISETEIRAKFGLSEPEEEGDILGRTAKKVPEPPSDPAGQTAASIFKRFSGPVKRQDIFSERATPPEANGPSEALSAPPSPIALLTDQMVEAAQADLEAMVATLEAMMAEAGDLGQFAEMVRAGFPELSADRLEAQLAQALTAAEGAGMAQIADGDG